MATESAFLRVRPFGGLLPFVWTETLVQLHENLAMATSMIVQGVLLIFVWILNPGLIDVALVGAILFSMFTMGQRVLNEAAYVRIDHKANELYLASPLTPEAYFLGMALGILIVYVAPVAVLGVLAEAVIHFTPVAAAILLGLAASVWLFSASIGYIFSTFFRDNRAIWGYSSLFFNCFGVLFPVFFPLSLFPAALHPLALLLPPSAAAGLMQSVLGAVTLSGGEVALAVGGLVAEVTTLFLLAVYWSRRTVREP